MHPRVMPVAGVDVAPLAAPGKDPGSGRDAATASKDFNFKIKPGPRICYAAHGECVFLGASPCPRVEIPVTRHATPPPR